jgi:HAMP domain-containing protein
MVATIMTVNMLIQDLEIRSMRDEIGNLKNEIKELRKTEGD